MNYRKALKVLELPQTFNNKILKQHYYYKSLRCHPDKNNNSEESNREFREVLEAYNYLKNIRSDEVLKDEVKDETNGYMDILERFIKIMIKKDGEVVRIMEILSMKYTEIKGELLEKFSRELLIKIEKFIKTYGDGLNLNGEVIRVILKLIREKTKNDKLIVINPSLNNLMNDEIYKLEINKETYLIPMWHQELVYDLSDSVIIVECDPKLPECMIIDEFNNLIVELSLTISSVLDSNSISINIENRKFEIPIDELRIKRKQRYELREKGVSAINVDNIFNVEKRSNIYVDICFTDII
jgi:hypothetical protein